MIGNPVGSSRPGPPLFDCCPQEEEMFANVRVVDLTQTLHPGIVMWPGAPGPTAETLLTVAHDGFYNRRLTFMEHSGTHFDAPCHMVEGAEAVDQIGPERLFCPVAVIDISARCQGDPDAVLTLDEVRTFEATHGRIPDGAAVFLRTGWEAFNTDPARYAGAPGPLRFPGFGPEAARFLVEERHVVGLGIDTLGIDPGWDADFVVHRQISHPRGVWHLEGLENLAQLPPLGAWVVVGVLKTKDGSGGPARVLALVP
jgi:kynurenine formamidase